MPEGDGIAGGAGSPGAGSGSAPAGGSSSGGAPVLDWGAFKSSLGDLGKDKSFEPIKDFNGLAKSYVESQKMIGGSIRLPKKDMKPEDREKAIADLKTKLRAEGIIEGAPETPDKYEIKMPTEEGFQPNAPLIDSFKSAAHKIGVPPSQVQGLFDWYLNFQAESQRGEQMEFENSKQALKSEWGGLYVRRMEAARRAASKFLGEDGDELISNLPPKAGVRILKALAEIGDPLLEDAMVAGEIPGVVTKEDLQNKINLMMGDSKHPLNNISHPGHAAAVRDYTKLQQDLIRLSGGKR